MHQNLGALIEKGSARRADRLQQTGTCMMESCCLRLREKRRRSRWSCSRGTKNNSINSKAKSCLKRVRRSWHEAGCMDEAAGSPDRPPTTDQSYIRISTRVGAVGEFPGGLICIVPWGFQLQPLTWRTTQHHHSRQNPPTPWQWGNIVFVSPELSLP